ncbi:MAG: hypothetical protein LBK25_04280 [Treponema sp.]|nr:hypothetical protein [Treponema sp.]
MASSRGFTASSRGFMASSRGFTASSRGFTASSRGFTAKGSLVVLGGGGRPPKAVCRQGGAPQGHL